MASLKKNVASQNITFALVSASAGSALIGSTASLNAWISKDGGAQSSATGTFTGLGNGQYNYAPAQSETNGTAVGMLFTASSAIPVNMHFFTDIVDANGFLEVDVQDWLGTTVATPATAGIPDINVKNINNVATTSVTTVSANQGTTQPINFTGTAGSALVKVDVTDIATVAVNTASAQLGVNVVQINAVSAGSVTTINANQGTTQPVNFTGTAASALVKGDAIDINSVAASAVTTIAANIGTTQPVNFTGTAGSALVKADTVDIAGSAVSATAAQVGVNVVNIAGQAATLDANNLLQVDVEDINGNATAAQNVSKANQAIGRGTCTTGGTTTSIPTSAWTPGGAGIVSGQFIGRTMIFDATTATAALRGQATNITANTASATPTFTVTALTTAPASGDTFGVY